MSSINSYRVRLILIRHAESIMNIKPEIIAGQSNSAELTPLGIKQAELLGKRFLQDAVEFDFIFTSTAVRTKQTATIAVQAAGKSFQSDETNMSDCLLEQAQGDWEGKERKDVYDDVQFRKMDELNMLYSAPQGESLQDVQNRALLFLNPLLENAKQLSMKNNKIVTIGLFTHGGTIRTLIQHFMTSNPQFAWLISQENTAISEFAFTAKGIACVRINDIAHLANLKYGSGLNPVDFVKSKLLSRTEIENILQDLKIEWDETNSILLAPTIEVAYDKYTSIGIQQLLLKYKKVLESVEIPTHIVDQVQILFYEFHNVHRSGKTQLRLCLKKLH